MRMLVSQFQGKRGQGYDGGCYLGGDLEGGESMEEGGGRDGGRDGERIYNNAAWGIYERMDYTELVVTTY